MESLVDERLLLIALLENLVGTWHDNRGSTYELSLDTPPNALTVKTKRADGTCRSTKGLIQLRLGDPCFYYICWGNNYVLDGALLKLPPVALTWNRVDGSSVPFVWIRKGEVASEGDVGFGEASAVESGQNFSDLQPGVHETQFSEPPNVVEQQGSSTSQWATSVTFSEATNASLRQDASSNSWWPSSTPMTPMMQAKEEANAKVGLGQGATSKPSWLSNAKLLAQARACSGQDVHSSSYWAQSTPDTHFPEVPQPVSGQSVPSSTQWSNSAPDAQLSNSHWPNTTPNAQFPEVSNSLGPEASSNSQWSAQENWNDQSSGFVRYPWVECMDEAHDLPYYYNTVTGFSAWQLPQEIT